MSSENKLITTIVMIATIIVDTYPLKLLVLKKLKLLEKSIDNDDKFAQEF